MSKAKKLRELLQEPRAIVVAGAHHALSAKLVERAGFDAIWASGFEISAAWGVPDASSLTMTESLEVAKQLNDAVAIPVIADCDTGYGNAINAMRTVEAYEQAGIAGISLEDNVFPKRCSFYAGVQRELVPIEEHIGKIRAAKAAQKDPDFFIIARTEALIAGMGMQEALDRATAYAQAGADAVLVHSKSPEFDELKEFAALWTSTQANREESKRVPLVIVPTTFPSATVTQLEQSGYKIVIFANHAVRASIRAMRETLATLKQGGSINAISDRIVPLEDVYDLMGLAELKARERRFLSNARDLKAVIVAAGFEKQLLPLIQDIPKCLLDIKGKTILERQVELLRAHGIQDVIVIRGYQKDRISFPGIRYFDNDEFEETGEVVSLFRAESQLQGPFLLLYSDILFEPEILEKLLRSNDDISLVLDRAWPDVVRSGSRRPAHPTDLVITRNPPKAGLRYLPNIQSDVREDSVLKIGQMLEPESANGEFIGLAKFSGKGAGALRVTLEEAERKYARGRFHEAPSLRKASLTDLLQEMIDSGRQVGCTNIYKGWMEVDTFEDYQRAWARIGR